MHSIRKVNRCLLPALLIVLGFAFLFPANAFSAKKDKFVVVIDAGHGGSDPGAVENEVKEKDVNLAVALKLAQLIDKNLKDTEVILTRDKDEFVSLQKRADLANKAQADLFISIHSNSVDPSNPSRETLTGSTTYILGKEADDKHIEVVQNENKVIDLDATDKKNFSSVDTSSDEIADIFFEMSYNQLKKNSQRFAKDVQVALQSAGQNNRGVHTAGFWVLWSTSMPSVLVELDFLCNPERAKFLSSEAGQNKLAMALFTAVEKYEKYYRDNKSAQTPAKESVIEMAKDRAEEEAAAPVQEPAATPETTPAVTAPVAEENSSTPSEENSSKRTSRRHKAQTSTPAEEAAPVQHATETPVEQSTPQTQTAPENSNTGTSRSSRRRRSSGTADTATTPAQETATTAPAQETSAPQTQETTATTPDSQASGETAPSGGRKSAASKRNKQKQSNKVYRILLFSSSKKYDSDDDRVFKNLQGVTVSKENNTYHYTYGETTDRAEIEKLLKKIKKDFPEAQIQISEISL